MMPVADGSTRFAGDRACPAQVTLARVRPHFPALGITRVGLVTGLSRLGIPVGMAVRPNGLSLSVHQGKGLTDDDALVSAAMEAVEVALAECVSQGAWTAAPADVADGPSRLVDLTRLTRCRVRDIDRTVPLPLVRGTDLVTGTARSVPAALVAIDHTGDRSRAFDGSSDGLASGNTPEEAVLHGLLELVERDAVALAGAWTPAALGRAKRAPGAFGDPVLEELANRIEASGSTLALFDVTSDIGIPVIVALLTPGPGHATADRMASAATGGQACHPDPGTAAIRAALEACQAQLTAIAGARDDIGLDWYRRSDAGESLRIALGHPASADAPPRPDFGRTASERIAGVLARLTAGGIGEVVAVPIPSPIADIHVVRMIVPGLEIGPGAAGRTIGRRLLTAHLSALA
jgi:ribosomal protein S12 methylthiotransferase accessory factor